MREKIIVSLLSIRLVLLKLSYIGIGNLNSFNVTKLLKINAKEDQMLIKLLTNKKNMKKEEIYELAHENFHNF